MDKASLIGIIIGAVCLGIACHHTAHGNWMMFYSIEGVLLVIGGSISVVFMSMPLEKVMCLPGYLKKFMFAGGLQASEVIGIMNTLAERPVVTAFSRSKVKRRTSRIHSSRQA